MNYKTIIFALCLGMAGTLAAQSIYPGQHAGKMKVETSAPVAIKGFDLKDIRLLPSRFRDNMLRDSAWMASIDVNRLLHSFRTNAGVCRQPCFRQTGICALHTEQHYAAYQKHRC